MLRILDARLPGSVGDRPLAKGWEDFSAARKAATAYDQLHSNRRESAAGKCRSASPRSQPTRQGFLFAAQHGAALLIFLEDRRDMETQGGSRWRSPNNHSHCE